MTDGDNFFLISFDEISEIQRQQIHHVLKNEAESWWHRQQNLWIVQGGTSAKEWRELVAIFTRGVPGNVLVLKLPSPSGRNWAASLPPGAMDWFKETYTPASSARALPKAPTR